MNKVFEINICKMMVQPVAVCGSETWATTEMDVKRHGRAKYNKVIWTSGRAWNMGHKN